MYTYETNHYRYKEESSEKEYMAFTGALKGRFKEFYIGDKRIVYGGHNINTPKDFTTAVKAPT